MTAPVLDLNEAQILHCLAATLTTLDELRVWLDTQERDHATHVRIDDVRRVLGWTRKGTT
jgi:hypothetical protein